VYGGTITTGKQTIFSEKTPVFLRLRALISLSDFGAGNLLNQLAN